MSPTAEVPREAEIASKRPLSSNGGSANRGRARSRGGVSLGEAEPQHLSPPGQASGNATRTSEARTDASALDAFPKFGRSPQGRSPQESTISNHHSGIDSPFFHGLDNSAVKQHGVPSRSGDANGNLPSSSESPCTQTQRSGNLSTGVSGAGPCSNASAHLPSGASSESAVSDPRRWIHPSKAPNAPIEQEPYVENTMDLVALLQPKAKKAGAPEHSTIDESREEPAELTKPVPRMPPACDQWPNGESTVDLVQLLQPKATKAPPQDRIAASFVKPAPPSPVTRYGKLAPRTPPAGESTCELAQLLQPQSKLPSHGKAQHHTASQPQSAPMPEATEDLDQLLLSAASKIPAASQGRSCPRDGARAAKSEATVPKPRGASESESGALQFTDEFMGSLEHYIEDSRRDFDQSETQLTEDQSLADSQADIPAPDSFPTGLRRLHGRVGDARAHADAAPTAGGNTMEPYLAAALELLGRGRHVGGQLLADALSYIQAGSDRAHWSACDFDLGNAMARPQRHVVVRILKQLLLAVFIVIVLFLIAMEMNWRLGPQPEIFY